MEASFATLAIQNKSTQNTNLPGKHIRHFVAFLLMSLQNALTLSHRQKIPENVFAICLPNDRIVVENILSVLQQIFPTLPVVSLSITKTNKSYKLCVPLQDGQISLSDLKTLEAYSPSQKLNGFIITRFFLTASHS